MKVCSSAYRQGHYSREEVDSALARAAFQESLTPKPRRKKGGSPATSPPLLVEVETPTGRVGALGIGSLDGTKRQINRELEATGPGKKMKTGPKEDGRLGRHRGAAELSSKEEAAEAAKLQKEKYQDLMFTGHSNGILAQDEEGNDRHLGDLSSADQRDITLRAAALQFHLLLVDMPEDVRQLLMRVGDSLKGASDVPSKEDIYALVGLGTARSGSTIKSYVKGADKKVGLKPQQRGKHERDWLLNDEELMVDARQWINRQKCNISADKFSAWLMHGDELDDQEKFEPIGQGLPIDGRRGGRSQPETGGREPAAAAGLEDAHAELPGD